MAENNNGGKHTIEDVLKNFAETEENTQTSSPTSQQAARILAKEAEEHIEQRKSLKEE